MSNNVIFNSAFIPDHHVVVAAILLTYFAGLIIFILNHKWYKQLTFWHFFLPILSFLAVTFLLAHPIGIASPIVIAASLYLAIGNQNLFTRTLVLVAVVALQLLVG